MTIEQFWEIIERVHATSPDDMERKCELLGNELRRLQLQEISTFGHHFGDCFRRADTYDIMAAAVVICDSISDDSFMDFRSTLISLGRKPFEAALTDTDSLSQFDINPEWARFEGYQYVPGKIYKEMGGPEPVCDCPQCQPNKVRLPPAETQGKPTNPWEMSARFPKLAAKYGFKDSDWLDGKLRKEKQARDEEKAGRLALLMLEAGIIPSSGLIPPPRIVARLLPDGHMPESTGRNFIWEPYELDEAHYWIAVGKLQKTRPEELVSRPDLLGKKLNLDVAAVGANDFENWIQTLKARGLA